MGSMIWKALPLAIIAGLAGCAEGPTQEAQAFTSSRNVVADATAVPSEVRRAIAIDRKSVV